MLCHVFQNGLTRCEPCLQTEECRIKIDHLMSLALFFPAQHVSNASRFIFRSLRLCVGILLWLDVCWRYGVVRLGWCGILMLETVANTYSTTVNITGSQSGQSVW
jgi:hypothetical protein